MTEAPKILLAHHLKTLKLPTFLREYDKLARQCAAEGLDHVRFLARLVELELIDRERRFQGPGATWLGRLDVWTGGRTPRQPNPLEPPCSAPSLALEEEVLLRVAH